LNERAWVPLAEVARPHGVRGELRLKLYNTDSDILLELDEVLVRLPGGDEHEVSIDGARRADQAILMKLHSIDDRDRAEELRGAVLCVRRGAFPPLEPGEFYACDVEGAEVLAPDGRALGRVRELRAYPSVDALIVDAADGGEPWEIPLVEAFVRDVDVGAGKVSLATLDGLERG
jgi:16S rRNA processing protein RimM